MPEKKVFMRVLIVEDEVLLAEELAERLVEINSNISVEARLGSVKEAVEWLSNNRCDLLFLDIHLNDGLSFSIFDSITPSFPVIFTTAYDEYAIQAFDINSIAYLLKPIDDADLEKALEKYQMLQKLQGADVEKFLKYIGDSGEKYLDRLTLSLGKIEKPFNVSEIAYFYAEDRFVFAVTKEGKKFFCDKPLYQLEEELNPKIFIRVNRSFIVSYESVSELVSFTKGRVLLNLVPVANQEVVVSSEKAKELRGWLEQ